LREFSRGSGAPATHREKVKTKVRIANSLGTRSPGHRLGNEQGSVGWHGFSDRPQQSQNEIVVVVMEHPNEGDQIGTGRQRIDTKVTTNRLRAPVIPSCSKALAGATSNRRQIK
jgi:hypothetical protein